MGKSIRRANHRIHEFYIKSSPNLWVRLKFYVNPISTSIATPPNFLFTDLSNTTLQIL